MFKRRGREQPSDDETTMWTFLKDEMCMTKPLDELDGDKKKRRSRSLPRFRSKKTGDEEARGEGDNEKRVGASERDDEERSTRSKRSGLQSKVVYHQFTGDSAKTVMTVEGDSVPPEVKSANHVLIKVEASTVTVNDCLMRRGFDFDVLDPVCLPATPGSDVVGTVVEVGENVEGFKPGHRVACLVKSGGNARFISVPASSLVPVPKVVDSAEAACMISTYSTAYKCLKMVSSNDEPGLSLKGKKVLIVGGGDPVAQALVHLCNKAKAKKIFVSAKESRHLYIRTHLRATPISLDESEWPEKIKGEMDFVFDGRSANAGAAKACLNQDGRLVIFGMSSMLNEREIGAFGAPMSARMTKMGNNMRWSTQSLDLWESYKSDPDGYKENLKDLLQLLKWQKVKPPIAGRVGLHQVAGAQDLIETLEVRGIIVCLPWKRSMRRNKDRSKSKGRGEQ